MVLKKKNEYLEYGYSILSYAKLEKFVLAGIRSKLVEKSTQAELKQLFLAQPIYFIVHGVHEPQYYDDMLYGINNVHFGYVRSKDGKEKIQCFRFGELNQLFGPYIERMFRDFVIKNSIPNVIKPATLGQVKDALAYYDFVTVYLVNPRSWHGFQKQEEFEALIKRYQTSGAIGAIAKYSD